MEILNIGGSVHSNMAPLTELKSYPFIRKLISFMNDPFQLYPVAIVLFLLEIVINILVINYVKYTEIDWKAYMQEVEGVWNGTFDYAHLKGDTGPLVYPAGFVWIFLGLYFVTGRGSNILLGQYIFAGLYLINLALVLRIHIKAKKVPPYVLLFVYLTSYRVHSIFTLRLFNDPVAMVVLYGAINAFLDLKWNLGSFLYSIAVSAKMNILLYSPALLLTYIKCLGLLGTVKQLAICAGVQIILALPFLFTHPVNYFLGAFNFGRVFLHEWTVNWRFLPESIFVDRRFHIFLLVLHILLLAVFFKSCSLFLKSYATLTWVLKKSSAHGKNLNSQLFLLPMFLSNFIGIACSRSLHYQFYVWYFDTLPYLLWCTRYTVPVRLCILGVIELCWNTFPSTPLSSAALHCCHVFVLFGIFVAHKKILADAPKAQQPKNKVKQSR